MQPPFFNNSAQISATKSLNHQQQSLNQRLESIHSALQQQMPNTTRIGVALYESSTDDLYTFIYSDSQESPFNHYQVKLNDCLSLKSIKDSEKPRILNNIDDLLVGNQMHTAKIVEAGYRSSATFPMIVENQFLGFIFFNSFEPNAYNEQMLVNLSVYEQLISLIIYGETIKFESIITATKSAYSMMNARDPETGGHLARVSLYSKLIARTVADHYGLDDEQIQSIYQFSILHDFGKLRIRDEILFKKGKLTKKEYAEMQQHSMLGVELIEGLIESRAFSNLFHQDILINIIKYHHERSDGSGYPEGLTKLEIPFEARIVAVADVFDALTTVRPYKRAWTNEDALGELQHQVSVGKLEQCCVEALLNNSEEIHKIQAMYFEPAKASLP